MSETQQMHIRVSMTDYLLLKEHIKDKELNGLVNGLIKAYLSNVTSKPKEETELENEIKQAKEKLISLQNKLTDDLVCLEIVRQTKAEKNKKELQETERRNKALRNSGILRNLD